MSDGGNRYEFTYRKCGDEIFVIWKIAGIGQRYYFLAYTIILGDVMRQELNSHEKPASNPGKECALQLVCAAGRQMRAGLKRLGDAIPEWTDYKNAKNLNEKLLWLTGKFHLSRNFALFEQCATVGHPHDSATFKNKIWGLYLAALGINSMQEILKPIKEAEEIRHWLPREVRPYFGQSQSFRPYFHNVIQCLDSLAEIPTPELAEIFKGQTSKQWSVPEHLSNKEWNFLKLVKDCNFVGDGLAREIIEANRRIEISCAVILAVCPDNDYQHLAAIYRPNGLGDPGN